MSDVGHVQRTFVKHVYDVIQAHGLVPSATVGFGFLSLSLSLSQSKKTVPPVLNSVRKWSNSFLYLPV